MLNRRDFLKMAAATGSAGFVRPGLAAASGPGRLRRFSVHPFIEARPDAVFIMRTHVSAKTNRDAVLDTGLEFARSAFVLRDTGGIPLSRMIVLKPNFVCSHTKREFPLEYGMGINTDPHFVEGVIEGMKELGLPASQFYIRELTCPDDWEPRGFWAMARRTGADLREFRMKAAEMAPADVNWVDIPDGWIHRRLPYLWPVNAPDTWLLNMAKFKTHSMGLTLCSKNVQGTVASGYQRFCAGLKDIRENLDPAHVQPAVEPRLLRNYARYVKQGIPRWDRVENEGALRQAVWATRTLDNLSVTRMGLCVIEGIYGRDGNAFVSGPNPPGNEDNRDGEAWDYMSNILIFGMDPIRLDIIGHWLGGHEPGNFGLFHLARERGLSTVLNPHHIPIYEWAGRSATLTTLEAFDRTLLKTPYLRQDTARRKETHYHLCDEPFDYNTVDDPPPVASVTPGITPIEYRPHPQNPTMAFEFALPRSTRARIDILNDAGEVVDRLAEGPRAPGCHMAVWRYADRAPGKYRVRLQTDEFTRTHPIMLAS